MMRGVSADEMKGGTRHRILEAAIRLFAEHGFDSVPLRLIASSAEVNGGAINYHFQTKEMLIREIYKRLFHDLNKLRLKSLEDYEAASRSRKPDPQKIVHAFVEPMIRFCMDRQGSGIYLVPLLFHARASQQNFISESIAEQVDHIAIRYVDAIQKAIPEASREDLFWRFDFALGAIQHVLMDISRGQRLKRISDGLCDTGDQERIVEQLVGSITASFTAPACAAGQRPAGRTRAGTKSQVRKGLRE
jgi:AcrR family transcriptional regulator